MNAKDKRYFWLKLKRDFFKRHDIQIVENMPNGKDYLLFYLKLLCESVDHDGSLRFSDQIPYNDAMLATITNTNIDIVRSAIEVFSNFNMMEILDDGTIYMNEVNKMLGSETYWADKKREQRKLDNVQLLSNECPTCPSKRKSIEIDKDKDKEEKPHRYKYGEYSNVLLTDEEILKLSNEVPNYREIIEDLSNYMASTGKSYKSHYATVRNWARKEAKKPASKVEQHKKMQTNDFSYADIEELLLKG